MPKGPDGKTFPTIGYAGWSMFADSENKDLAWKLIATLEGPEGNIDLEQARSARCRLYKAAEKDPVLRRCRSSRAGSRSWPTRTCVPTVMPTYLEEFAFFKDSLAIKTSQEALLGEHHAGGAGQAMGRLPDQGPAEVPREASSR